MRMPTEIEPEFVVESDGVDHQRVAIPGSDGIAIPGGIGIFHMGAPTDKDSPESVDVALKQVKDVGLSLKDPPRVWSDARHAGRKAIRFRIILGQPRVHDLL